MEPEARPDPGLRIDPVRVVRRRSVVPAGLIAIAVAFIGLAIVKPWEAAPRLAIARPLGSVESLRPIVAATTPPPLATAFGAPPTSADLLAASVPRGAWGIRAIVVPAGSRPLGNGTGSGLADRWLPIDVASGAAWDVGVTGTAVADGDAVIALGVTTPNDSMPLDIRFWRLEPGDVVRRIVPRPVRGPEAGSWLWLADLTEATALGGWPAGTYVVDVLLGPRIVRLVTIVPTGVPAEPRDTQVLANPADLVDQLRTFAPGPFAIISSGPIPIAVVPHDPLDERHAWLGPATGQLEIAAVGRVASDPVAGIGVVFEPGEELVTSRLERVAPIAENPGVGAFPLPPIPTADGGSTTGVVLEFADLRQLPTGLYHLTASSRRGSGVERTQSWNLDIAPSTPATPPGSPLVRMTRWVPLMTDPDRLADEPLVTDRDRDAPDGDGTCGGSAHVGTADELLGIVEPPGTRVQRIRLFPLGGLRTADVAVRIAPNVVDGLTVVAVPGGGLASRQYQLIVDATSAAGPDQLLYTVCIT